MSARFNGIALNITTGGRKGLVSFLDFLWPLIVTMVDWIRWRFTRKSQRNPYQLSLWEQLSRLRRANEEEGWKIPQESLVRLAESAPLWPSGKTAYRTLRIRFGDGEGAVTKTTGAHMMRIERLFGRVEVDFGSRSANSPRHQEDIRVGISVSPRAKEHHHVLEWVFVDTEEIANDEERKRVGDKRSGAWREKPCKALADEALVLAWMFPQQLIPLPGYDHHSPNEDLEGYMRRYPNFYGFTLFLDTRQANPRILFYRGGVFTSIHQGGTVREA